MPKLPLLLIADTSVKEALGSKLLRAAVSKGLQESKDFEVAYTSPAAKYSPSMSTLKGKIFYRLNDRRSREWSKFQEEMVQKVIKYNPQLVIVTGILPIRDAVFNLIHQQGGKIVNYLTDDPWNPIHRRRSFIKNIHKYDHIFSTKQNLRTKILKHGCESVTWLPFAYDPFIHYTPSKPMRDKAADVHFIGTGARERLSWLYALKNMEDVSKRIYGNNWGKFKVPEWEKFSAVTGEDYCNAVHDSKVVIGLVRKANGDLSTDRSYEIGAIGGCGIYQDTREHRDLLQHYPDEGFFKTPEELRWRIKAIIRDDKLQKELRDIAADAVRKPENTYAERLRTMLRWSD